MIIVWQGITTAFSPSSVHTRIYIHTLVRLHAHPYVIAHLLILKSRNEACETCFRIRYNMFIVAYTSPKQ